MDGEQWAVVELMGHVRIAGRLSEVEMYGGKLGRIDIPDAGGGFFTTQFFGASSVYRITLVEEAAARAVAYHNQPKPVYQWELPQPNTLPMIRPPAIEPGWSDSEDDPDKLGY